MNERIRADFPILEDIIYMDSAATSLTPEPVLEAVLSYYRQYNANVGRGVHRLSRIATQKYKDAHEKIAEFIGIGAGSVREGEGRAVDGAVIFTKNTTEAINMVAYGLRWAKRDEVVTTLLEHHSNFLPWLRLKEQGVIAKVKIVKPDTDPDMAGWFDLDDFKAAIDARTRLVAVTQVSNVLGTVLPVKEISAICKENGSLLLVDGAQSAPHRRIDVEELGCDFFAFSGHKMLGPTGTGILYMRDPDVLEPTFFGGGMVETVSEADYRLAGGYERFEAGTPHIAGGIGLGRAVDYLNNIGMEKIEAHEARLSKRLLKGLQSITGVQVYGYGSSSLDHGTGIDRIGVAAFNLDGLHPHDVAVMLAEASDIMVRSGHHCCMPLMNYLGLKDGTVRASLYLYNTEEEVDRFLETVTEIVDTV
ncbi:MAG: cysteine desulfurase [Methanophagales archaeon]|nr:cysteine desulfurase [Methanophagales archaeon]